MICQLSLNPVELRSRSGSSRTLVTQSHHLEVCKESVVDLWGEVHGAPFHGWWTAGFLQLLRLYGLYNSSSSCVHTEWGCRAASWWDHTLPTAQQAGIYLFLLNFQLLCWELLLWSEIVFLIKQQFHEEWHCVSIYLLNNRPPFSFWNAVTRKARTSSSKS